MQQSLAESLKEGMAACRDLLAEKEAYLAFDQSCCLPYLEYMLTWRESLWTWWESSKAWPEVLLIVQHRIAACLSFCRVRVCDAVNHTLRPLLSNLLVVIYDISNVITSAVVRLSNTHRIVCEVDVAIVAKELGHDGGLTLVELVTVRPCNSYRNGSLRAQ